MTRLSGKVAIITGASQGMGEAHARVMAMHGANVVMTDVNAAAGERIAAEIGHRAVFVRHDVADAQGWAKVVSTAQDHFGPVNVLVNNAGILGDIASTQDLGEAEYNRVIAINQVGVFLGMQAVLPGMVAMRQGSIVNISSTAGLVAVYGAPNLAYVASKFAVRGMTKQVAAEYGPYNIRVNSIHPGFIMTPMMVAATDENGGDALRMTPLRRMADPSEVSDLVVFLSSDESRFITGAEHVIDGGMTAL